MSRQLQHAMADLRLQHQGTGGLQASCALASQKKADDKRLAKRVWRAKLHCRPKSGVPAAAPWLMQLVSSI